MRREVSGVFSSWDTVATRLVFTSSNSRKRVTSWRMATAPWTCPWPSRKPTTRGKRKVSRSSKRTQRAFSKESGR